MIKPLTFEGRFECGFDEAIKGRVCALAALYRGPGAVFGLSICVANEAGHNPIPLHWCHSDNADELHGHAEQLNRELFGLDPKAATKIVASTMFGPRNASRKQKERA